MGFIDRLQHAWNAFRGIEDKPLYTSYANLGYSSTYRLDRNRLTRGNEKSIITAIYNRIAIDASSIKIQHVRVDEEGQYKETLTTYLNNCLTAESNKDQGSKAFVRDIVMTILDEGCAAIVPTVTDVNPIHEETFKIKEMRVGRVAQWYPNYVEVELYNDKTGQKERITLPKRMVAIVENPFYSIMNEPNSTLQRLVRKLNILDAIDEQSGSGKLDLIIQLPYVIKTEARKQQAELRRTDIESQLSNSKYGIAYTDGTEKITQLNRPVDNNLLKQVELLTSMLYSQLGITTSILDGSASNDVMLNYLNRTVGPIIEAIVEEMNRKFITKTARSQGQRIMYFNDILKFVSLDKFADMADKLTRNQIMSSNEVRRVIGLKPVDSPDADALRNKNLNPGEGQEFATTTGGSVENESATTDEGGY